jgi:hypothetical protein
MGWKYKTPEEVAEARRRKRCEYSRRRRERLGLAGKLSQKLADANRYDKKKSDPKFRESNWRRHLLLTYGLTADQYESMKSSQGSVCAICRQPERMTYLGAVKKLAVDHCHKTGTIRGLLCHECNAMLGSAKDSVDTLAAAIAYLQGA